MDDLADPVAAGRICQTNGGQDVRLRVVERIGHRVAHVNLGGELEDHLRAMGGEQLVEIDVEEIRLDEGQLSAGLDIVEVGELSSREVVDHDDLVPLGDEQIDQMRTDEPSATSDQGPERTISK